MGQGAALLLDKGVGALCINADHLSATELCVETIIRKQFDINKKQISMSGMATAQAASINLKNGLGVNKTQTDHVGNGIETAVGATTMTDNTASWTTNQFVGATLTVAASTATVTSNTGTVLTFSGGWTGGTPANSLPYMLSSGGNTCAAVSVPSHGILERGGDDWKCERGFMKRADACVMVEVPANAYLTMTGNEWQCERGFKQEGSTCVALVIPASAYLDNSGNEWTCSDGLRKQGRACIPDR